MEMPTAQLDSANTLGQCDHSRLGDAMQTRTEVQGKIKARRSQRSHQALIRTTRLPPCALPLYYQYLLAQSLEEDGDNNVLPLDPRSWTKRDVRYWLHEISDHHDIDRGLDANKFPFNGKALCALTLEMFQSRAPLYGKLLYKDVRLRLAKVLAQGKNDTLLP